MPSDPRTARMAGWLYLIGSVAGVFGILYGPSLVVAGDAGATARNIQEHASLFTPIWMLRRVAGESSAVGEPDGLHGGVTPFKPVAPV